MVTIKTSIFTKFSNQVTQQLFVYFFRMQDLNHKLTTMTKNRENLERMVYSIRDELSDVSNKVDNQSLEVKDVHEALRLQNKMFDAQASKLKQGAVDNENGQKLSETQKAALEAK